MQIALFRGPSGSGGSADIQTVVDWPAVPQVGDHIEFADFATGIVVQVSWLVNHEGQPGTFAPVYVFSEVPAP